MRTLLILFTLSTGLFAQGLEFIKANYTKYEFQIAMRDGKRLFTAVYVPKDQSEKWPMMMSRTPYSVGPYGPNSFPASLGPNEKFAKDKFIFVYQDVRGRNMSEGTFVNMTPHIENKKSKNDVDESSDTYDTVDWLVKNVPNNNGKVGQWGISYPGFYTAAGMIDAHPALVASSPQAPISDWFVGDDFHHNGITFLPHAYRFFTGFGRARPDPTNAAEQGVTYNLPATQPDGYEFFLKKVGPLSNVDEKYFKGDIAFWNEMLRHPNYDEYWQSKNLRPHLKNVKPAVMTVGGWFDAENLFGAINVYKYTEKLSPGANNILVMGPWYHGQWSRDVGEVLGNVQFDAKTSEFYRESIEYPFFAHYLKGKPDPKLPEAYVFQTGRNEWRKLDKWPPASAQAKSLYLHPGGKLAFTAPTAEGFEEYVSDPNKPVPYIDGQSTGMSREYMVWDQRFASTRPDVLTFQTDVLDSDVTLAGVIRPELFVSTTGTDSDWVVKIIDVFPDDTPQPGAPAASRGPAAAAPVLANNPAADFPNRAGVINSKLAGMQMMVRGEPFRGRFRNSYSKPEAFTPGKVEKVAYDMPDIYHTFRRGHRIMVQIQSSWFPLADRNPQKFVDIGNAKATDFVKATQHVYFGGATKSAISVGVEP